MLTNFCFPVNGTFHKFIPIFERAGDYFVGNFTRNLPFRRIIPRNLPQYKRFFPESGGFILPAAAPYHFMRPRRNGAAGTARGAAQGSRSFPQLTASTPPPSHRPPPPPRGRPRGVPALLHLRGRSESALAPRFSPKGRKRLYAACAAGTARGATEGGAFFLQTTASAPPR